MNKLTDFFNLYFRSNSGYKTLHVKNADALMHHYRVSNVNDFRLKQHGDLVDRTAHAWARPLMLGVREACSRIFGSPTGMCPY